MATCGVDGGKPTYHTQEYGTGIDPHTERGPQDTEHWMSLDEIAEVYGVSRQAIQQTIKRTVRKLWRQTLNGQR